MTWPHFWKGEFHVDVSVWEVCCSCELLFNGEAMLKVLEMVESWWSSQALHLLNRSNRKVMASSFRCLIGLKLQVY